ncbi:MAG: VOC family protein [Microbacterium sp.]|uniref:VOC family protein n=1 Tax=Microbacterium sp. TaxID=51671 RepID=UPI003F803D27
MTAFADGYDPGPQIAHCGAINLGTKDLATSLHFFGDLLGMEIVHREGSTAYLRGYQELAHHSLVLTEQPESVVNSYSFRVRRPQDVELFAAEFERQEIETVEVPAGAEVGRGTAVRFLVPGSGHPFELYYDIDKPGAPEEISSKLPSNSSRRRGLGVRRIDHFNVQTSRETINQAEGWVRENLGFRRREYALHRDDTTVLASWMSVTPQVHDLAMVANSFGKTAQLHHVAFNLENLSDVLTAADVLRDYDVTFDLGPGKHGIGQAMYLYVLDPGSGHRVEIYAGGYLIFEPDWEPIKWEREAFPDGLTWYGDPFVFGGDARSLGTTPSAVL